MFWTCFLQQALSRTKTILTVTGYVEEPAVPAKGGILFITASNDELECRPRHPFMFGYNLALSCRDTAYTK